MYRTVLHVALFIVVVILFSIGCKTEAKESISAVDRLYQEYEYQPNAQRTEIYLDSL